LGGQKRGAVVPYRPARGGESLPGNMVTSWHVTNTINSAMREPERFALRGGPYKGSCKKREGTSLENRKLFRSDYLKTFFRMGGPGFGFVSARSGKKNARTGEQDFTR